MRCSESDILRDFLRKAEEKNLTSSVTPVSRFEETWSELVWDGDPRHVSACEYQPRGESIPRR